MKLATIGYEGSQIEDFAEHLRNAGVEVLADVRELPISRKPGFAKTKLSAALEAKGIRYVHFKALGDPKPGRMAAREGNFRKFKSIFNAHLKTDEAQKALAALKDLTTKSRTCLMCFERNPAECHRTIIARHLVSGTEVKIVHLKVHEGTDEFYGVAAE